MLKRQNSADKNEKNKLTGKALKTMNKKNFDVEQQLIKFSNMKKQKRQFDSKLPDRDLKKAI